MQLFQFDDLYVFISTNVFIKYNSFEILFHFISRFVVHPSNSFPLKGNFIPISMHWMSVLFENERI